MKPSMIGNNKSMISQLDKDEQDPTEADEEAKKKTKQEQMAHTKKKKKIRDPAMNITGNEIPTYLVLKLLLL